MRVNQFILRFGGGLLLWTAAEYAVHRWIMHGRTEREGRAGGGLLGQVVAEHLDHHRRPGSTVSLRLDPHNIGYKSAAFAVVSAVAGSAVGAGFTVGYSTYTGLHDRIHHRRPRGPVAAAMWNHHLEHHRLGREGVGANFGVTSPLWDTAARTLAGQITASRGAAGRRPRR